MSCCCGWWKYFRKAERVDFAPAKAASLKEIEVFTARLVRATVVAGCESGDVMSSMTPAEEVGIHVNLSFVVRNLLSPNFCRDGVKKSLAVTGAVGCERYFRRDSGDMCGKEALRKEALEVIEWMQRNGKEDTVTVFLLQEAWPRLRDLAAERECFIAPKELKGSFGTTCVIIHLGLSSMVPGSVSVHVNQSYDISGELKKAGVTAGGTNNVSTALVSFGSRVVVACSAHLPFDRTADEVYLHYLSGLVDATLGVAEARRTCCDFVLGWDLSDYRPLCLSHASLARKFGYGSIDKGPSPEGRHWETELLSTLPVNRVGHRHYGRSDHYESVHVSVLWDASKRDDEAVVVIRREDWKGADCELRGVEVQPLTN